MTIEESDKYADILLSTPKMYDKYPDFFPSPYNSWVYGRHMPWGIGLFGVLLGPGVYDCSSGFSRQYEEEISEWKASTIRPAGSPRYLTFDDIKMMLYVGTEYARNKLLGYRFEYGDRGFNTDSRAGNYPYGCIVRDKDGHRWIHRTLNPNAIPPPGYKHGSFDGNSYGFKYWTPLTRRVGMAEGVPELVPLLPDVTFPFEPVTRTVRAATIVGNDDLVFLRDMVFPPTGLKDSFNGWNNTASTLCAKGGFVIRISPYENLEGDAQKLSESSLVLSQGQNIPVYLAYYGTVFSIVEKRGYTLSNDTANHTYIGNWIPLAKGVTYHIYIQRTESCVSALKQDLFADGGSLSVVRMPMRGKAPSFKWEG